VANRYSTVVIVIKLWQIVIVANHYIIGYRCIEITWKGCNLRNYLFLFFNYHFAGF